MCIIKPNATLAELPTRSNLADTSSWVKVRRQQKEVLTATGVALVANKRYPHDQLTLGDTEALPCLGPQQRGDRATRKRAPTIFCPSLSLTAATTAAPTTTASTPPATSAPAR